MCLSNVYTDTVSAETLILGNVQRIDCKEGFVVLTDLLERQVTVEGRLVSVDLVGSTAIITKG